MPFLKQPKKSEPLWKEWDYNADKRGLRHTVYSVNGDEYTGEWLANKRHGRGTYKWKSSGHLYDGDWKNGRRSGFGTYSIPCPGSTNCQKQYSGGWKNDKKHGFGTFYYSDNEYYEGEWFADQRSGWGRMYYANGEIYEGEWYGNEQSGQGMYKLGTENRYEGTWKGGRKNGPGKFYYIDKGQVFDGIWVDDVPKCGEMKDLDRETAPDPTPYPIPQLELLDPDRVLLDAEEECGYVED